MKLAIRRFLNQLGYDIVKQGSDPINDMKKFLHDDRPLIFDVGANIGQSVHKFRGAFPKSIIHSFEPSYTTFEQLNQQVSSLKDVYLWNHALGASSAKMNLLENTCPDMSSFLPLGELGWGTISKETLVEVKTIDEFCRKEGIEKIDILKSDTQGFDFEVFKGAENSFRENKIGLIYFEVIFSKMYENIPPFTTVLDFLIQRDFSLVSFYKIYYQNQLASWTDALFVHKSYRGGKD